MSQTQDSGFERSPSFIISSTIWDHIMIDNVLCVRIL